MWDDELRTIPASNLKKFDIGAIVQPVIWWYQPEITFHSSIWKKYASIFSDIWVASSFKGATGPDQILSNISEHPLYVINPLSIGLCFFNIKFLL